MFLYLIRTTQFQKGFEISHVKWWIANLWITNWWIANWWILPTGIVPSGRSVTNEATPIIYCMVVWSSY